jgi:hypothetical protein
MAKNKTVINIHARNYIAAVFEKRLREEGFTCPDDKLLCWYRAQGNQILNSIIFFSPWSNLPLMMDIGYGIHPLFSEPVFTNSVHFTKRPSCDDRFVAQPIIENVPINSMGYSIYSPEIWVDAPGHPGKGIYTLDEIILPKMEQVHSVEEAYAFHKKRRQDSWDRPFYDPQNPLGPMAKCFIDMVLYSGDSELYPYLITVVNREAVWYRQQAVQNPNKKELAKQADEWEFLLTAFTDEGRKEYLEHLSVCKEKNIQYLKKKLGVAIPG